jgi:hypothetical protein
MPRDNPTQKPDPLPFVPEARVYGSPSISKPPSQASNSPKGRVCVARPRICVAYAGVSICEFFEAYQAGPASSMTTRAPARVRA